MCHLCSAHTANAFPGESCSAAAVNPAGPGRSLVFLLAGGNSFKEDPAMLARGEQPKRKPH